jgi:AraC family transcriptional regulator
LQHEVAAALEMPLAGALEAPQEGRTDVRFAEHLRPHGDAVSRRVQALQRAVQAGERAQDWLDQQLLLLLGELLTHERRALATDADGETGGRSRGPAQAELQRRLRLAADFIDSCHRQPIALDDMARVACLSRYHFVRHFRALHGLTPYAYLLRKRARAARRLLAAGETDRELVALQVGFGSRFALARALQRHPAPAGEG